MIWPRAGTADQKSRAEAILAWIQGVMAYYYERKKAVKADVDATWDFAQFDVSKPTDTLETIIAG